MFITGLISPAFGEVIFYNDALPMRGAGRAGTGVIQKILVKSKHHFLSGKCAQVELNGLPLALFAADDEPLFQLGVIHAEAEFPRASGLGGQLDDDVRRAHREVSFWESTTPRIISRGHVVSTPSASQVPPG
ncbi:MAG: hypothetical protein ABIP20_10635 [Chthoniobacteraceae bacterium]